MPCLCEPCPRAGGSCWPPAATPPPCPRLLQDFYETTLRSLEQAKNERLLFKTNLKLANLWFKKQEYGRLGRNLKELHRCGGHGAPLAGHARKSRSSSSSSGVVAHCCSVVVWLPMRHASPMYALGYLPRPFNPPHPSAPRQ